VTPASVQAAVVIPTMVVSALINPDRANPEATEYRALIDERTPGDGWAAVSESLPEQTAVTERPRSRGRV